MMRENILHDKRYNNLNNKKHPAKTASMDIILYAIAFVLFLAMNAIVVNAADIEVSKNTYITSSGLYDTSPSIVSKDGAYFLFYARADDDTVTVAAPDYDPMQSNYTIYYRKAASIEALSSAPEAQVAISGSLRPQGLSQKIISAVLQDGKIYLFTSNNLDSLDGSDNSIYYYIYQDSISTPEQDKWSGPYKIVEDSNTPIESQNNSLPHYSAFNVNAQSYNGEIYLSWSTSDGGYLGIWNTSAFTSNISQISLPDGTERLFNTKIYLSGNEIYAVGINQAHDALMAYSAQITDTAPQTFNGLSIMEYGAAYSDYSLFKEGNTLYFLTAYDDGTSRHIQYAHSEDDGMTWYSTHDLTLARQDFDIDNLYISQGESWNESGPILYFVGDKSYVIYSTESFDNTKSSAKIAFINPNIEGYTDVDGITHYTTIQDAVNYASAGYNISVVDAGTYTESLYINIPLNLYGNGAIISGFDPNLPVIEINTYPVSIRNLTITQGLYGVLVDGDIDASKIVLHNDKFSGNSEAGLINYGTEKVNALYCYWDDNSGPSGIGSGTGEVITGEAKYSPWYDSSFSGKIYDEMMLTQSYLEFNSIEGSNVDKNNVISNLNLLRVSPYGAYIDWTSSDESIIDAKGDINRSSTDRTATLTAQIFLPESMILSQVFSGIVVKANSINDSSAINSEYGALTFNSIRETNPDENDIMYYLTLPTQGINDTSISWSSNDSGTIDKYGNVIRSDRDIKVRLSATISRGNQYRIKNIDLIVKGTTDPDYLTLARAQSILTNELILNANPSLDNIISGLYLPSTLPGFPGLTIEYLPSDGSVIGIENYSLDSVKFSYNNSFSDNAGIGSSIYQSYQLIGAGQSVKPDGAEIEADGSDSYEEYGPISGNNIVFSCGSCSEASFMDATLQIDLNSPFCGYDSDIMRNLIIDHKRICAFDSYNNKKYNILFKSYRNGGACIDGGDGSCAASSGHTSYVRTSQLNIGDVDHGNAKYRLILKATLYYNSKYDTKQFVIDISPKDHLLSFDDGGNAVISKDSQEAILDSDNFNDIRNILVDPSASSSQVLMLDMDLLKDYVTHTVSTSANPLYIYRKNFSVNNNGSTRFNVTLKLPANSIFDAGDNWNGLFTVPNSVDKANFAAPNGGTYLAIKTGGSSIASDLSTEHFTSSRAIMLEFDGVTGKKVAYSDQRDIDASKVYDLTDIPVICNSRNSPSNIPEGKECYFDDGKSIVIWTYHLSIFALYDPNAPSVTVTSTGGSAAGGSGGGGGGGAGGGAGAEVSGATLVKCSEDWVCTKWSACSELGSSIRSCSDQNSCGTETNKPATVQTCNAKKNPAKGSALFDIILDIISEPGKDNPKLLVDVGLINFGSEDTVDANLTFTITDGSGSVVKQYGKVVPVKTQLEYIETVDTTGLGNGKYYLTADLAYAGQKDPARAQTTFVISDNAFMRLVLRIGAGNITAIIIGIVILGAAAIWYFNRRKGHDESENKENTRERNTDAKSEGLEKPEAASADETLAKTKDPYAKSIMENLEKNYNPEGKGAYKPKKKR